MGCFDRVKEIHPGGKGQMSRTEDELFAINSVVKILPPPSWRCPARLRSSWPRQTAIMPWPLQIAFKSGRRRAGSAAGDGTTAFATTPGLAGPSDVDMWGEATGRTGYLFIGHRNDGLGEPGVYQMTDAGGGNQLYPEFRDSRH